MFQIDYINTGLLLLATLQSGLGTFFSIHKIYMYNALDKREYLVIIRDKVCYFA